MVRIQVLGLGNSKHRQLSRNLLAAISAAGIEAEVEQVTEVDEILRFKVSSIPAIIYEGRVFFENGRIPSVEELCELLTEEQVRA
jgi:small redox-active disulfide protein 2